MATKQELEQLRADPRVQQMLTLISRTEGTFGAQNPYAVYGGNIKNQLPNFSQHPGRSGAWQFKWNDGSKGTATASGRYQIISSTWNGLAKRYGLTDFSPVNQDLAAIALMSDAGAIEDIRSGNFQAAMKKLGKTWASLPSSPYAQAKRSQAEFNRMLAQTTGGVVPTTYTAPILSTSSKASNNTAAPALTKPTNEQAQDGIGNVLATASDLSKDELAAIMPESVTAPRVTDTFFNPVPVDWKSYYG